MEVKSEVFLMDCIEGMKQYPDKYFDLAVVDPPYGNVSDVMNPQSSENKYKAKRTEFKTYKNAAPTQEYFSELDRVSKRRIIWGANFFGLKGGYICWNKNGTAFGECELAFDSGSMAVRLFEYTWNGMLQGDMKNKEIRIHTHQKPVALYIWIFKNYATKGMKILDTHLGSGSSRIAADKAGLNFTGYEIDEDYFDAQDKRFKEYKLQLKLF